MKEDIWIDLSENGSIEDLIELISNTTSWKVGEIFLTGDGLTGSQLIIIIIDIVGPERIKHVSRNRNKQTQEIAQYFWICKLSTKLISISRGYFC